MNVFWSTYSLIVSTLLAIALLYSFYLFILKPYGYSKTIEKIKDKSLRLNPTIKFLLWTAVIIIILGFWMPFILTFGAKTSGLDFTKTGAVGDTFGGIINPFVGISASIITGLAFYVQYQANQSVTSQFENQDKQYQSDKFEKLFFEQIRLYKENVTETQIWSSHNDYITGRMTFSLWSKELPYLMTFLSFILTTLKRRNEVDNKVLFKFAYFVFYKGQEHLMSISELDLAKKFEIKTDLIKIFKEQLPLVIDAVKLYSDNRLNYSEQNLNIFKFETKEIRLPIADFTLFRSKDQWLSQYFRHIFYTVKCVAENNNLSYEDKRQYLRILRNQISNQEQVLIFYNWLGGYGSSWEEVSELKRAEKKGNYFFSDYRMIHNITNDDITNFLRLENEFIKFDFSQMLRLEDKGERDVMFDFQNADD
ncbi:hypothetical protein D3C87_529200 [compost metagenome]